MNYALELLNKPSLLWSLKDRALIFIAFLFISIFFSFGIFIFQKFLKEARNGRST